ncbi:MAG: hypothetical protein Q4G66_06960 [bacterium]|nr:hypothetical protein [bacterium]
MPHRAAKHLVQEHEFISPSRAATLCSVSVARFESWMRQGLVPVVRQGGRKLIKSRDLIEHLISHNIRIPEELLQGGRKKILFIGLHDHVEPELAAAVVRLLYRLREREDFIVDFIRHGEHTELKIITLEPDKIVLLGADQEAQDLQAGLRRLLAPETSIQCLHPQEGTSAVDAQVLQREPRPA